MLHAVIMAGGAGTRFWPASRALKPKQLLDLVGERTMIQATVDRLEGLVPAERTWIITNEQLVEPIAEQLPALPRKSIIGEPCKRDTAPCIGLAAAMILHDDPAATMVVLPADHAIEPVSTFRDALAYAADLVEEEPSRIVTFGIRPTYAATCYGYIEFGETLVETSRESSSNSVRPFPTHKAKKFREKPNAATATEFLATKRFFWNSGIFVWKAKTIRSSLERFEPNMQRRLQTIADSLGSADFPNIFVNEFTAIQGKSIDYAVLEHHDNVVVIEAPYHWDDVGNWQSLARLRGQDDDGNTIVGRHIGVQTSGSIVRSSDDHLVVTLGMKDCIVVHTPDATLVANKNDEEAMRKVVEILREKNWHEFL